MIVLIERSIDLFPDYGKEGSTLPFVATSPVHIGYKGEFIRYTSEQILEIVHVGAEKAQWSVEYEGPVHAAHCDARRPLSCGWEWNMEWVVDWENAQYGVGDEGKDNVDWPRDVHGPSANAFCRQRGLHKYDCWRDGRGGRFLCPEAEEA